MLGPIAGGRFLPQAVSVVGSQVLRVSVFGNLVGTFRQVSALLPYPAAISWLAHYGHGGDSSNVRLMAWDIVVVPDAEGKSTSDVGGLPLGSHRSAGTSPPDLGSEMVEPFVAGPAVFLWSYPLWVVVPGSGWRIALTLRQGAAGTFNVTANLVVLLTSGPAVSPLSDVTPRGEPDKPMCVDICNWPPGLLQPGGPGGPGAPPPPPAPESPNWNYIRPSVPSPCNVDTQSPLQSALATCLVP